MTLARIEELMRAVEAARAASAAKLGKDNQILKDFFETLHEFKKELLVHVNDVAVLVDARDTARAARDLLEADKDRMREALRYATETLERFAEPWKDLQCDCDTEHACGRHNAVNESLDQIRGALKGTP